ncbi:EF-hand domain-containing protein [Shimia sp. W99]
MKHVFPPFAAIAMTASLAMAADTSFLEDWDLDADGGVTWAELEQLRRNIFDTFDADGDGALNSAEYTEFDHARAAAAEASGHPIAKRAVHGLAREGFDKNLDGMVTREEFETALREWFEKHDGNKNGILEKGDF